MRTRKRDHFFQEGQFRGLEGSFWVNDISWVWGLLGVVVCGCIWDGPGSFCWMEAVERDEAFEESMVLEFMLIWTVERLGAMRLSIDQLFRLSGGIESSLLQSSPLR